MSEKYERLRGSDDSREGLLNEDSKPVECRRWKTEKVLIIVEAIVIVLLLAAMVLQQTRPFDKPTLKRSFETDFDDLGDVIPFTQQAFINPLRPTPDHSALKMEWKQGEPHYTGTPGPDLDEAWEKLLGMTTFNLSGKAAEPAVGKTYQHEDGKYEMGLEVFHALHCINNIRMMMYPENYILNEPADETEIHKAHCLDYLRQYVQCNADLTPFWGDWVPKYRLVLRPYTPHTCRDFSKLTEWIADNRA